MLSIWDIHASHARAIRPSASAISSVVIYLVNMHSAGSRRTDFKNAYSDYTVEILQKFLGNSIFSTLMFMFCGSATVSLYKIDSSPQMYSALPIHYDKSLFGHKATRNDS